MTTLIIDRKQVNKYLTILISFGILLISCYQNDRTAPEEKQAVKDSLTNKPVDTPKTSNSIPILGALPDSGKPFFKVAVYRNNDILAQYEGDWAIALQSGKNMSIQFPASPRMLKISHGMIMYFNSPAAGSFQIAPSGNEKEKPVIIFTPEIDGAYGIAISAASGTVTLTKYANSQISGNIDAAGKDENGNVIKIQAVFINVKNNISN